MATDKEIIIKLRAEVSAANNELKKAKEAVEEAKKSTEGLKEAQDALDKRYSKSRPTVEAYKESIKRLEIKEKELERTERKLTITKRKLGLAQTQSVKVTNNLNKSMAGASNATGAATSATLELGRVISDSPYGIRGMANNISQLASNIFFMSKKTDEATGKTLGLKGALGNITSGILGPAGVLIAFQAIIAAFEAFSSNAKSADEQIKSLTQSVDDLITKFKIINTDIPQALDPLLESLGLGEENTEWAAKLADNIKILNNEFPEFKTAYEKLTEEQKKDQDVVTDLIQTYKSLMDLRRDIIIQEENISNTNKKIAENDSITRETTTIATQEKELRNMYLKLALLEEIFKKEKVGGVEKPKVNTISSLDSEGITTDFNKDPEVILAEGRAARLAEIDQKIIMQQNNRLAAERYIEEQRRLMKEATLTHAQSIFSSLGRLNGMSKEFQATMLIAEHGVSVAKQIMNYQNEVSSIRIKAQQLALAPLVGGALKTAYLAANLPVAKMALGAGLASTGVALANGLSALGRGGSGKTPSVGGSGGQGGREFDFNLVGSTREDQLAQAVGGQFQDQTVRAYVVGSDITNRQQLDNKIKTTATFGD